MKKWRVLLLVILAAALALAFASFRTVVERPAPVTPTQFIPPTWSEARKSPMHEAHVGKRKIACAECHGAGSEAGSEARFDAPPDLAACARSDCHAEASARAHVGSTSQKTTCLTCHSFAATPTTTPCVGCHEKKPLDGGAAGVAANLAHHATPDAKCGACHKVHAAADAGRRKNGDCSGCHADAGDGHGAQARKEPDASLDPATCASCHGPHEGKAAATQRCVSCHAPTEARGPASARHGLAGQNAPRVLVANIGPRSHEACTSCHAPHDTKLEHIKPCAALSRAPTRRASPGPRPVRRLPQTPRERRCGARGLRFLPHGEGRARCGPRARACTLRELPLAPRGDAGERRVPPVPRARLPWRLSRQGRRVRPVSRASHGAAESRGGARIGLRHLPQERAGGGPRREGHVRRMPQAAWVWRSPGLHHVLQQLPPRGGEGRADRPWRLRQVSRVRSHTEADAAVRLLPQGGSEDFTQGPSALRKLPCPAPRELAKGCELHRLPPKKWHRSPQEPRQRVRHVSPAARSEGRRDASRVQDMSRSIDAARASPEAIPRRVMRTLPLFARGAASRSSVVHRRMSHGSSRAPARCKGLQRVPHLQRLTRPSTWFFAPAGVSESVPTKPLVRPLWQMLPPHWVAAA